MAAAGVPVPRGRVVHRLEAAKAHALTPPYVLKPVSEGSSLRRVHRQGGSGESAQELTRADWVHGEMMLAEQFIAGRELTCAVMATVRWT